MSQRIRHLTFFVLLLFANEQSALAQNCNGPLNILLSGSNSAESLMVEIEATEITCTSDANGSISLSSSGGNPTYVYSWADIMSNDSIRENLLAGTYDITVTDAMGCSEMLSWVVTELSPENSSLAIEDGCGTCLLGDGSNSYFFNEQTKYIASLSDENSDSQVLGNTEVCLYVDNSIQACNGSPYLQRQWSISPDNDQYTCMKLYFTESELENLAAALPNETTSAQELIANQRICVSALNGGSENCTDYESITTYSTADAPPLILTEEDATAGIWSVNICTDEFATFYVNVCDVKLPVELIYFSGQRSGENNVLHWETAVEENTDYFEIQKGNDPQSFYFLGRTKAIGNSTTNQQYTFVDDQPSNQDYYRLKIVDNDGSFAYSNTVVINRATINTTQLYPTLFNDRLYYETDLPLNDELTFQIYDAVGQRAFKQAFKLVKGAHRLVLKVNQLPKGNYFVEIISKRNKVVEAFKVVKR